MKTEGTNLLSLPIYALPSGAHLGGQLDDGRYRQVSLYSTFLIWLVR